MSDPWFKKAFEAHYLEVYAHRDDAEAKAHLPQIIHLAQLSKRSGPILDLGCGQGRYSKFLQEEGYDIMGLDYSGDLLQHAKSTDQDLCLLRGNMLQLPFKPCFSHILSLFTSFGYFDQDEDNLQVLKQMSNALVNDGVLYLDFLNPENVTSSPWEQKKLNEHFSMSSQKNIDTSINMVFKDVKIYREGELIQSYQERVKLYDLTWFERNAKNCGLTIHKSYGNYEGAPIGQNTPRNIYVMKKN
jgi:SAM-dependent methyltransferase